MIKQNTFLSDESGAVTVDWVVLTAALVGLGLAVITVVRGGINDVTEDMNGQLRADGIIRTNFSTLGASDILTSSQVSALQATAEGLQNDALSSDYAAAAGGIDSDYGAWKAGIADGTYLTDGSGSYYADDGNGAPDYSSGAVFTQSQYDSSAAYSDAAAVYADEASQRGLSWNDSTSAFE